MKRFLIVTMSIIIAVSSAFFAVGCVATKPSSFTVTFVSGADDAYLYSGEVTQTVSSHTELEPPVFVRPGYNMDYWDPQIIDIKGDTTVTAKWTKYKFNVTFNANGGKDAQGNTKVVREVDCGIAIEDVLPEFMKKGYSLSWDAEFGPIKENCTINAIWTANKYKLSFSDGEGGNYGLDDVEVTYDKAIPTLPTLPDKTEGERTYRFARWKDANNRPIASGMMWTDDADLTLYAEWSTDDFIINYDLCGGNEIDNPNSYSRGEEIAINNPTRKGYEFIGWTGTGLDGLVTELIISSTDEGDKNFVANWRAKSYTLTLDFAQVEYDGSNKVIVTYDQPIGMLPQPTKEHSQFVGWKCSNGEIVFEGTVWTIDPQTEEEYKLTAVFEKVYTVKFSLTTIVRGGEVTCGVKDYGSFDDKNIVQDLEELVITIREGQSFASLGISVLPIVDPIEDENTGKMDGTNGEYSFGGYWKYSNAHNGDKKTYKVQLDTIFNAENFPGVGDDGVITLIPHCRCNWTPSY